MKITQNHSLFSEITHGTSSVEDTSAMSSLFSDRSLTCGYAEIAPDALDALFRRQDGAMLSINTLNAGNIELVTASSELRNDNHLLWCGRSSLLPNVEAHLSVTRINSSGQRWQINGRVFLADGTRMLINAMPDGKVQLTMMSLPPSAVFSSVKPVVQTDGIDETEIRPLNANSDAKAVIKVLPAYPASTLNALGGNIATVTSAIGDWELFTNQILINSGINASIVMAPPVEVPEPKTNKVHEFLYEVMALRGTSSRQPGSLWDVVSKQRNSTNSDIVLLLAADWTGTTLGESGIIPLPPRSDKADELEQCSLCFCPKKVASIDIAHVFAHEFGHLMGGQHDPETDMQSGHHDELTPAMFDYVCGYQSEDRTFTTTMGYPREEEMWIPYYSSSDQTWLNPITGERVAVGIPVGKPGAADAAAFFRSSTRTLASYRGGAAMGHSYALSLDVTPPLGGALQPESYGPYPDNSTQTVKAIPRAGYIFDHWELDGLSVGSAQPLSVLMKSDHKVIAHFKESDKLPRLTTAVTGKGLQTKVSTSSVDLDPKTGQTQNGPEYQFGTEVIIECRVVPTDLDGYTFSGWSLNGSTHLVKGHSFTSKSENKTIFRLIVRLEEDVHAEAQFTKK